MKKWIAMLLSLVLVFSLAACGGRDDDKTPSSEDKTPSSSQQQKQDDPPASNKVGTDDKEDDKETEIPFGMAGFLGTKTGKFYSQFADGRMYMEYEMEMEGQVMSVISATSGDKTYSETKMGDTSIGVSIMIGEDMYTIDHAGKMVIKMSQQADAQTIAGAVLEESDVDMGDFKTGTREIDGKAYDTEEWIVDDAACIFCFDGDNLAYMIGVFEGEEMIMKVVEASNKVDDRLFEIPEDYTMMDMSGGGDGSSDGYSQYLPEGYEDMLGDIDLDSLMGGGS